MKAASRRHLCFTGHIPSAEKRCSRAITFTNMRGGVLQYHFHEIWRDSAPHLSKYVAKRVPGTAPETLSVKYAYSFGPELCEILRKR